ncbi:GNAT family N-acetyltransferase [Tenacibaculum lutimaris]|uniref:GNAT family N-acetyltransferase n=1 Tax=Tenacibaculum lutimaris TaxID=285258 RepID=UPI000E75F18A|nr:GNAT family N-acetyltransferase [Tenacibaculum lutimaris]
METKEHTYTALKEQSFSQGEFSIVPIRFEDKLQIMQWRNEQMYHLRQAKELTENDQETYFNNVVSKLFNQEHPSQILFSYLKGNKCIGYGGLVHINWIDKNAEISFIMDTSLENDFFNFHWKIYLGLIEKVAFDELNLHKIFTYAFDLRPHLYAALEESGYDKEAVLKEHCFYKNEFKDVIIHSKKKNKIVIRDVNLNDVNLLFDWANDELTRKNSFNSNEISFKEHEQWFTSKLKDNNSLFFIGMINTSPIGLVRYEVGEENTIVSISIDKNFRGKKLAPSLLKEAAISYFKTNKKPILAYIKKENIASVKSFEKAGYTFYSKEKVNNIDSYIYKLESL